MNGESNGDRQGTDWQDRAIDAALQEVHGGKVPDLSARVLLALHENRTGPLPTLRRRPVRAPNARQKRASAGAWPAPPRPEPWPSPASYCPLRPVFQPGACPKAGSP